jgi:hypothetical protein
MSSSLPHLEVLSGIEHQPQTGCLNHYPLVTDIWEVRRLCSLRLVSELSFRSAAVFGGVENDTVILNIDNLWEGGPFADPVRKLIPKEDIV